MANHGAMPRQARKQAVAAKEAQEQLIGKPGEAAPDSTELEAQPAGQVPAEQNLDQPTSSTAGEEPAKKDEVDWEARFKGAQAAYNRDVPRLRTELDKALQSNDELRGEVAEIREMLKSKTSEPTPQPEEVALSDEELEQYGPGLVHVIKTIAEQSKGELAKEVVALRQELANLGTTTKEIVQNTAQTAEDRFFESMDKAIPEWESINLEQGFHDFLAEVIPYSGGRTRQDVLTQARESLDARTAIELFTGYVENKPSKGSSQSAEPIPDLTVPPELETPKNSGGGVPPVEEAKYYTQSEISQFYKDKAAGLYRGKEDEAKKIETDIFAAGQQGRILSDKAYEKQMQFQN